MKQIIIGVLLVVGIIAGAMVFSGDSEVANAEPSNNFYGAEDGVVTITEFGDFQCPACGGFYPILKQVKEQFKDQLRFEFKHFPLVQIHPNATAAHRAAQAASNQGKFWEMHDRLYEQQQSWSETSNPTAVFEQYARDINLDMEKYLSEVSSSQTLGVINADIALGKENDVSSTPTFFLDGKLIEDLNPLSTVQGFSDFVQDAIDEKKGNGSEPDQEGTDQTSEPASKPEESEPESVNNAN